MKKLRKEERETREGGMDNAEREVTEGPYEGEGKCKVRKGTRGGRRMTGKRGDTRGNKAPEEDR
ncbi:hypothetical protein E2C01_096105 [Portunus trituberculatus]|uniref:Uncharacterized protein n=1 Tax=Portunus trituberculatus TaxID=210409 RepID=A0A5B7JRU0_PORTR|nr:hypothetical protein [Portunus trituberculatus]